VETTEFLLKLSRDAQNQADDLRGLVARMRGLPVRTGERSVCAEVTGGHAMNAAAEAAALKACGQIMEAVASMDQLIGQFRAEAEVVADITDDLIAGAGRLF